MVKRTRRIIGGIFAIAGVVVMITQPNAGGFGLGLLVVGALIALERPSGGGGSSGKWGHSGSSKGSSSSSSSSGSSFGGFGGGSFGGGGGGSKW